MRVVFLLGAGVSLPAGVPSTAALTDFVFDVQDHFRHSDERYYRRERGGSGTFPSFVDLTALDQLLRILNRTCSDYFDKQDKHRGVNYEDIAFAAGQLHEHLAEEYENPVLEPYTLELLATLSVDRVELEGLLREACTYLHDVVANRLRNQVAPAGHLACLVDALRDGTLLGCNVVTLNHDTLIEKVLADNSIEYADGFGTPDGDVRWWAPRCLASNSVPKLLKLHGSVDWFRYQGRLANATTYDFDHARTKSGRLLEIAVRDQLLMGTFNKIRDYSREPYFNLNDRFRRLLAQSGVVIASGYSFGDKGVNGVLANWMLSKRQRRLIVLSADPSGWIEGARGAIRNLVLRRSGQLLTHPRYLCDCTWHELKSEYHL